MKKITTLILLAFVLTTVGCKKFLNVDPPSNLSGNNFWKSYEDVDNYTNGLFESFRAATFRSNMKSGAGSDEFPFFPFTGDMRMAPVVENTGAGWQRTYIKGLRDNNLRLFLNPATWTYSGVNNWNSLFNTSRFFNWDRFFKVVASANILIEKVSTVDALSEAEKKRFIAEGTLMRNMAYFMMVRLWGDVPYYTKANNTTPLSRTNMLEVLRNCVADLSAVEQDLPWTYNDPGRRAVRGMRGGALILLMHMKMWLGGFDEPNAQEHFRDAVEFGLELTTQNGGAYELLPFERYREIFRGRSKEGLFEIPQNINYGERFGWSFISDHVTQFLLTNGQLKNTYMYWDAAFLNEVFPSSKPDKRTTNWLKNRSNTTGGFSLTKYANTFITESVLSIDDSQILFRYADAFLLLAEAYAAIGETTQAVANLDIIKARAGADPYSGSSSDDLKKEIWDERCREFIGESQYYYDLVRTKNILDRELSYSGTVLTTEQFRAGAWTWPLSDAVRINNPQVTYNNYWR